MKSFKKGIFLNNKIIYKIYIKKTYNKNTILLDRNNYILNLFKYYNIYYCNSFISYKLNNIIFEKNKLYKKIKLCDIIK